MAAGHSDYFSSGKGLERLEGVAPPKLLQKLQAPSTKCTTDQPIKVDTLAVKEETHEVVSNGDGNQDGGYSIPEDDNTGQPDNNIDGQSDNEVDHDEDYADNVDDEVTTNGVASDENNVQPNSDQDLPGDQDPAKDDDYDATVSTKKYFAPKESYFPDHYLDDAKK